MTRSLAERVAAAATGLAAIVVVVAIAIVPFLSPAWVAFEQGRSEAAAWTGYSEADLRAATDSILHDLVIGPPAFDVSVAGAPVLEERERAHMRDVRGVFGGFAALAALAAAVLVVGVLGARRMGHSERAWSAISTAMRMLVVGIVIGAVIATFAFDAAFEVFHRLFFPGGSYTFDPRTDKLVQLFPFTFWSETTIVLGGVIVVLAVVIAWTTRRLARRAERDHDGLRAASGAAGLGAPVEAGR